MPEPTPISVRLPADLDAAVRAKAVEEDLSMTQVIRRALRLYLGQVEA